MSRDKKRNRKTGPRPQGRGPAAKESPNSEPEGWFRSFWTRYGLVTRSLVIFFALVGLFLWLYSFLIYSDPFAGFLDFTAGATGLILHLTDPNVRVEGPVVSSPRFAFQIVDLCTAIMPMMIFSAGILAFPSRVLAKIYGLTMGLVAIFIINQIRLLSLFYIGIYAPNLFEAVHLLVWQSLMILLALGLWLLWIYRYARTATV
jgi:exosortase/archaeosortase family protein